MNKTTATVYALSILVHAGLAAGMSVVPAPVREEQVRITLRDVPAAPGAPPPAPTPEPTPTPTPTPAPSPKVKRPKAPAPAPEAAPSDAPPAAAPAVDVPRLGVAMTGAVGPGGVAVPIGDPSGAPRPKKIKARDLGPASETAAAATCAEPESRPRVLEMPEPGYDEGARAAGVEGRVRVRITVDASGQVTEATVVESLHPELDVAALRAARAARFEPAKRCGAPVEATFNMSVRFAL